MRTNAANNEGMVPWNSETIGIIQKILSGQTRIRHEGANTFYDYYRIVMNSSEIRLIKQKYKLVIKNEFIQFQKAFDESNSHTLYFNITPKNIPNDDDQAYSNFLESIASEENLSEISFSILPNTKKEIDPVKKMLRMRSGDIDIRKSLTVLGNITLFVEYFDILLKENPDILSKVNDEFDSKILSEWKDEFDRKLSEIINRKPIQKMPIS